MVKLSFCITCMNRFHQISKTLPINLRNNRNMESEIEFVLVDFNSQDGLRDWILEKFQNELKSGYLKYFHTKSMKSWHACIAKNTSHSMGNGNILVNLDADNFTGPNGGEYIIDIYEQYGINNTVMHMYSGWSNGSCGRIAVSKKLFFQVGGYDQNLGPMGMEDIDLLGRLINYDVDSKNTFILSDPSVIEDILGITIHNYIPLLIDSKFVNTIQNTFEDSFSNIKNNKKPENIALENYTMIMNNLHQKKYVANLGKKFLGLIESQ